MRFRKPDGLCLFLSHSGYFSGTDTDPSARILIRSRISSLNTTPLFFTLTNLARGVLTELPSSRSI